MNTIQRLLYESMRAHADRRAIVDSGSRNSLTYSELYDRASSVAGYLRSQGMDTGDYAVIALYVANSADYGMTPDMLKGVYIK